MSELDGIIVASAIALAVWVLWRRVRKKRACGACEGSEASTANYKATPLTQLRRPPPK